MSDKPINPRGRPKLVDPTKPKLVYLTPLEWEQLKSYGKSPGQAIRCLLKSQNAV